LSKKGARFASGLKFDKSTGKVSFVFPEKTSTELTVMCPLSGESVRDCGGYWEFPGVSNARFWKQVAKRKMDLEDYVCLVKGGAPVTLDGFISNAGKPFSAALVLQPDGKVSFSFGKPGPSSPGMSGPGAKKKKKA
jgi:hypothetical protein